MRLSLRTCHRCTSLCHACDKADERRMQNKDPAYRSTPGPSGSSANRGAEDRAPLRLCACAMARERRGRKYKDPVCAPTESLSTVCSQEVCLSLTGSSAASGKEDNASQEN